MDDDKNSDGRNCDHLSFFVVVQALYNLVGLLPPRCTKAFAKAIDSFEGEDDEENSKYVIVVIASATAGEDFLVPTAKMSTISYNYKLIYSNWLLYGLEMQNLYGWMNSKSTPCTIEIK